MKRVQLLGAMIRADFLERVRRYSFLLTLGFAAWLGYLAAVGRIVLTLGRYRGLYNSAWIGALMALVISSFLSLAGFYMVKNAIDRDEQTRVGRIIAATPMTRTFYVLAKFLSNFAVLASMTMVIAVCGAGMQWLRAEDRHIQLWALLAPFLLIALPAMAMTAALAILFESISWLKRGLGNVVYFFGWSFALAGSVQTGFDDFAGIHLLMESMRPVVRAVDPTYVNSFALQAGGVTDREFHVLTWTGVDWTAAIVGVRLLWFAVAVGIALLAAVFFHRFDPARERRAAAKANGEMPALEVAEPSFRRVELTPVMTGGNGFVRLLRAELKLMFKERGRWWYVVAGGLFVASLAAPTVATGGILAAAWIWPVLTWSAMGTREARNGAEALVFSCPHSLRQQLPTAWLAGVIVAAVTGGGAALHWLFAGQFVALQVWAASVVFIPSMALAMGIWSRSSKMFEVLYTVLWYGAIQMPLVDFTSATGRPTTSVATGYAIAAAGFLAAAFVGRKRQLHPRDSIFALARAN